MLRALGCLRCLGFGLKVQKFKGVWGLRVLVLGLGLQGS